MPQTQTNYAITSRQLGSKNAQNALRLAEQVLQRAKLSPYEVEKVIHQIGQTASPGVGFRINQDHDPEKVAYAAAWSALYGRQPGFLVFGGDDDGQDSLYHFLVPNQVGNLSQILTQFGIQSFWIKPTPNGQQVSIYDSGRKIRQLIEKLAAQLAIDVIEHQGNGMTIGDSDPAKARQLYRSIIREFEGAR